MIIKLNNITKVYGKEIKTKVLKGVNLEIENGSFNAIIGQSGSGKSTILNIMGTLDKPTDGDVIINDENISGLSKNKLATLRNKEIGFVFQFHHLLPEFTAIENVMMPALIEGKLSSNDAKKRAQFLLEKVGLFDIRNNKVSNMSGGQQQRVSIARSLMNNPSIILADEPTGNLDSDTTMEIYNLLRDINRDFGTTFVIITHDDRVAKLADRIIEIDSGNIVKDEKQNIKKVI